MTTPEQERLREIFARIPYARLLGLELLAAGGGEAAVRMPHRAELTRNEGITHGGALASLVDTASAFAVMSVLSPGETTVTVDLTIHFLRPVLEGEVTARARVLRAGRRLVTVQVDATAGVEKLVATAITTYTRIT
ncbi:MAG TPA: PaaI family thioesterase [Pyrinomonadaceae bacterium]|nr:PaaI family thioesterase [Pyrinomonadaceae bacterium]